MKQLTISSSRSSNSNSNSAKSYSVSARSHRQTYIISSIGQKSVLDYEGTDMKCYCGKKAPLWASWTNVNPGRRFVTCAFFNRCNFHKWVDDEMPDRAKKVIIGLRNREKELVADCGMLADECEELRQKEARLDIMVKSLKNEAKNLKEVNERLELVVRNQICCSEKMRRRIWFIIFCWTVFIVMYCLA